MRVKNLKLSGSRTSLSNLQSAFPPKVYPKLDSSTLSIAASGKEDDFLRGIEKNIIGRDLSFCGPFGRRRAIYMDHTASGQPIRWIEDFISAYVLPYYSNTHTTGTLAAAQTSLYRDEAREIVRRAVGADEDFAVIFCGSGSTAAVHKIVHTLCHSKPEPPIVFLGPFEHHSNILPWREIGAKIIYIPQTQYGGFDIKALEKYLKEETENEGIKDRQLIGSFSATSNVTGMPTDDVAVTVLLHKYGALSLWDYSAAGPHAQINVSPTSGDNELAQKDAIFFSGHKFLGGPQTPGVLVAKINLFGNEDTAPHGVGGGTVLWVTDSDHRYLDNPESKEEGGTPGVVETIRLGLVFKLKETIGSKVIMSREAEFAVYLLDELSASPEIHITGSLHHPRIPIISFLIYHSGSGYYLHHNFIVAMLNDLFGMETRGGCACAGPYAMTLLGIGPELAREYQDLLDFSQESGELQYGLFKPGFTRLSLPYYSTWAEVKFVAKALILIARHGWKLLPFYTIDLKSAEFHHIRKSEDLNELSAVTFSPKGIIGLPDQQARKAQTPPLNYTRTLRLAKKIFKNLSNKKSIPSPQPLGFDQKYAKLRWFLLPAESIYFLSQDSQYGISMKSGKVGSPFGLRSYSSPERLDLLMFYPESIPYQVMDTLAWTTSNAKENTTKISSIWNYLRRRLQ